MIRCNYFIMILQHVLLRKLSIILLYRITVYKKLNIFYTYVSEQIINNFSTLLFLIRNYKSMTKNKIAHVFN